MINLQRNERGRDDDGENFRPTLQQQESDALDEKKRRVKNTADAGERDRVGVQSRRLPDDGLEVAIVRIDVPIAQPLLDFVREVAMQKFQNAQSNRQEEDGFQQSEN